MKIGIIGSGLVSKALAKGFRKYKYEVMVGSRDLGKISSWKDEIDANLKIGDFNQTANFGDLIVLAVKGSAAEDALKLVDADNIKGKTIIDANNPIDNVAPVNGVLKFYTDMNYSLMEQLQSGYPQANFVKAFSCVGNAFMVNPKFGAEKPTMFICGNNASAKMQVIEILDQFGWEIEDMGQVEAARAIEPLCMLWCIPGLRENRWTHAFRLLKL